MAKKEEIVGKELSKEERVAELMKKMNKEFGKGSIIGAKEKPTFHSFISTGSIGLDKALGIGGLPKGRIVEIYGPESSGKTTVAIHVIAEAHRKDPTSFCAFVDVEHAFDTGYATALGVDMDRLKLSQPDYGEQALEIADQLIGSGDFDVVVIDSVAALVPKSELEGEMGEASMGKHARLMSQALRKMTATISRTNTLCIFINQMRDKIGVMFGSPETTTGGNALKFYASVRLDVRRSLTVVNSVMQGEQKVGNQTTVKVIKNKVAPPFVKCEFDILYGQGIDKYGELIGMAVDSKIMDKSGSFLGYGDFKVQGQAAMVQLLKDNDELFEEIKAKVIVTFLPEKFVATDEESK